MIQYPPEQLCDDTWLAGYLALVEVGIPPYLAAAERGVPSETFIRWLCKGGHPNHVRNKFWVDPDEAEEPYKGLVEQTLQAEAKAHNKVIRTAYDKAVIDGAFGLKWLTARLPEYFDPRRNDAPQVVVVEQKKLVSLEDWRQLQREQANDDE